MTQEELANQIVNLIDNASEKLTTAHVLGALDQVKNAMIVAACHEMRKRHASTEKSDPT